MSDRLRPSAESLRETDLSNAGIAKLISDSWDTDLEKMLAADLLRLACEKRLGIKPHATPNKRTAHKRKAG